MNHHISGCAAKEGITYSFDNATIIDYQDNYKYMGDVPFTISILRQLQEMLGFFYARMFVVNYSMIVSLNKQLGFPKIVIYRSFDQNLNEIENMSHLATSTNHLLILQHSIN